MDFDNFTLIKNTGLLSNLESNKGITVFIPNNYSLVLNSGKSTYKKKLTESSYKKKRLDNHDADLTKKVKQILNFHLNSISKESNEINNCKEAYPKDSSERNNDQIDYSERTKEQLAEHMENPSALIYGEQLTDKSENRKATENLIDNSVLNELQTMKNTKNSESLKKAANLDLVELMRLIT
ncbi:hypothetical protein F8M41_002697 [Gigaspora margarita]|uniref:FAS1 domain-containing protein n=1 Tax=Gigaspora margarita TaxID=4874 RepID=A0A8H4AYI6_GIGMA|nr:hypothetical protein F8M41_002697 [Gigaspora margarita]